MRTEYEKLREDSWEYQKYQLESKIERKRFDYENALYEQRMAQKHMGDFWQNIQISVLWAFGAILFPFLATKLEEFSRLTGVLGWVSCPFLVGWSLVCLVYTLGRIKFGFSYKARKRALNQEDILVGKRAVELHKLELELEKYSTCERGISVKEETTKQNQKVSLEMEKEEEYRQRQMRQNVLKIRLDRAKKKEKMLEDEMEDMIREENILRGKEWKHRCVLIGSLVGEGIGLILLGMPGNFIEVACSSWCLLLPPFVIFPSLCFWLRARMELSVGEELWFNRVFFSFLYENSIQKRRENVWEKIQQQQQKIEEFEQELLLLASDKASTVTEKF